MVDIRKYKNGDYDSVVAILKDADFYDEIWESKENINGMVSKDPSAILVADLSGKVVGCIFTIEYGPKLHYLFRLVVKEDNRKKGIGTGLMEKALKIAKDKNVKEIGMYVDSENKYLHDFYTKRKFKKSKKSYFYMWKEL